MVDALENEYDISPRPVKRRRLRNGCRSSDAGDFVVPERPETGESTRRRSNATTKPKNYESVNANFPIAGTFARQDEFHDAAAFDRDDIPLASQPWSTRGPIWAKSTCPPNGLSPDQGHLALTLQTPEPLGVSDAETIQAPGHVNLLSVDKVRTEGDGMRHENVQRSVAETAAQTAIGPSLKDIELAKNARPNVNVRTRLGPKPLQDLNRTAQLPLKPMTTAVSFPPTSVPTAEAACDEDSDYGSDGVDFELATLSNTNTTTQFAAASCLPPPMIASRSPARGRKTPVKTRADDLLADLPSDAFSDSEFQSRDISEKSPVPVQRCQPPRSLQQMTLFGSRANFANVDELLQPEPTPPRAEPPTHHKLDPIAVKKWIYPMNLGNVRDYQYNIVQRGLFHNLLVALPTGLGKTFIAATIMLNWYRWTSDAQIVFVAPTKPLVSQQVDACLNVAGIPRSQTTMLTGGISPALRAEEWKNKRLFFMTPQTLVNDLKSGIADPKRLVLLVVDEAHRATGNYAYVEVVRYLRRFTQSFRVLALTATPGNSIQAVQNVIDGLGISRIEIRTEFSLDIRRYVHSKDTDRKVFNNSEEILMVMEFFKKAVQPVLNKLCQFNAFWNKDPLGMTAYGLIQARQKWAASDAGRNAAASVKGMVQRIFQVLASLAHGIDLLKYHGITPFYHNMARFRDAQSSARSGGGKYEREILDSDPFQTMMTRLQHWVGKPDFIGHPKLDFLQASILEHFAGLDDGQNSATRVMIFAHFRDSAEEIVRVLRRHSPIVRPHVFVGQASSKDSEGMDQKKQLEIINDFKAGKYNTLVATSIGEEGLDIGEIDLIICYDSSSSPIRMLQRMGRTGRKRAGKILLLLMSGKEENSYVQAQDNYKKMQHTIAEGTEFNFHDSLSRRILPIETQPELEKCVVEIPKENESAGLPEPTKANRRAPKRPPKRFNMPDGVMTGFVKAGALHSTGGRRSNARAAVEWEEAPQLEDVCLTVLEERSFNRKYVNVAAGSANLIVDLPDVSSQPASQSTLGPTYLVAHSARTETTVNAFRAMRGFDMATVERWDRIHSSFDIPLLCEPDRSIEGDPKRVRPARLNPEATRTMSSRPAASIKGTRQPLAGRKHTGKTSCAAPLVDAGEGQSSPPPATDPQMQLATQGISLGSSDTAGEDPSDSDAATDLSGWLVRSDVETSVSEGDDDGPARRRRQEDNDSDIADSSDESIPELSVLVGRGAKALNRQKSRALRKRVVEESDDD